MESSKDYFTGDVTLLYTGDTPSEQEQQEYLRTNYSGTYTLADHSPPSVYNGLENPGILTFEEVFTTLRFDNRDEFNKAVEQHQNSPRLIDIGYADMIIKLEGTHQ